MGPVVHPHPGQGLHGPVLPLPDGHPLVDQREDHILQGVQFLDEVVPLEDEPDLLVADMGQLPVGQSGDIHPVQPVVPVGGDIQAAQHIHQGGFARAGLAHDGHELAPVNGQGDPV